MAGRRSRPPQQERRRVDDRIDALEEKTRRLEAELQRLARERDQGHFRQPR